MCSFKTSSVSPQAKAPPPFRWGRAGILLDPKHRAGCLIRGPTLEANLRLKVCCVQREEFATGLGPFLMDRGDSPRPSICQA